MRERHHPVAYEQLTSLGTAVGPTTATLGTGPMRAVEALFVAETSSVRFRDDGTSPTATVGFLLEVGVPFIYTGDLTKIKFIQTAAGAKLNCAYYA